MRAALRRSPGTLPASQFRLCQMAPSQSKAQPPTAASTVLVRCHVHTLTFPDEVFKMQMEAVNSRQFLKEHANRMSRSFLRTLTTGA